MCDIKKIPTSGGLFINFFDNHSSLLYNVLYNGSDVLQSCQIKISQNVG